MIVWVILVLFIAAVLTIGIERVIARLGIRREETGPSGLAIVAERLERWTAARRRK